MANSQDDGWNVVSDESPTKVIFDTIGDVFQGVFEGEKEITPKEGDPFTMYLFRGPDGELFGIPESFKIKTGMAEVKAGQECRIEYVKDVNVGRPQPMKDYRISVRDN